MNKKNKEIKEIATLMIDWGDDYTDRRPVGVLLPLYIALEAVTPY